MKNRIGHVNLDTGEVLGEGVFAFVVPKRRNGFGERWFAMAQDPLDMLAESELTGEAHRVLYKLLARLDFENLIAVNQSEIARSLKLDRTQISRSIKALAELGVLLVGPRIGVNRSYRLNPKFGWKGSAKNHNETLKTDERLQQRMHASGISGVIDGGLPDGAAPLPRGSHGGRAVQPRQADCVRDPNTIDMFEGMQP